MRERERHIHAARVYIQQASAFGARRSPFAFTLLEWAANARRRAVAGDVKPQEQVGQMELFS